MRAKRSKDTQLVDKFSKQREDRAAESRLQQPINPTTTADCDITEKEESDLNGVFSEVVGGKRRGQQEDGEEQPKTKKKRQSGKDEEYYIPYRPKDFDSERGLSLGGEGSAFEQQASSAVLDLMGDEGDRLNQQKKMMKWDRKKKRFVRETGKEDQKKKIKTDSGQVISNKKNRKNLYPSNKKLLCVPLSMTLFSTPRGSLLEKSNRITVTHYPFLLATHRSTFSERLRLPKSTTERHRKSFLPVAISWYNSSI
ncbi:ATP-dependent RNA helicase DDX54-like [Oreochromis aureus]|uniref:ATP-dependent RNA helicase DDX54-like n=1 Tax=Oreochromis aureus TaxID=47969 RepID=UPI001954FBB8|nr:ATP-dependent RNA helicase DDX54-like [Oreochromis aureus]